MLLRGFALATLCVVSISLLAQVNSISATLPVKITAHDQTGAVIPGAEVKVNAPLAPLTDANGQTLLNLPVGKYELLATAQGFVPLKKPIDVTAAGAQDVEFTLIVGSGGGVSMTPDPNQLTFIVAGKDVGSVNFQALKAMPHQTVTFHNVHTKADETYSGVPLSQLLASVGVPTGDKLRGKAMSDYIVATGSDGYKAVLALAETDPAFHPGDVIIADSIDGKPLDAKEGPFKLVVTQDKRPARSVHNLVSIELRTAD